MFTETKNRIIVTCILVTTVLIDQVSKFLISKQLEENTEISLGGGIIQLSLVLNSQGFLGFLKDVPPQISYSFLVFGVMILLIVSAWWLFSRKHDHNGYIFPFSLVVGGGSGNLIDRFIYDGGVVDFLSVGFGSVRTGILNFADLFILFGAFVLGYRFMTRNPSSPD